LYKYYLSLFSTIMENPDKIHSGSVLITGGSGMVGRYLTSLLLERGHSVASFKDENQFGRVRVFRWELEKGILILNFRGRHLVHLADRTG
jgi:nucleoside-diphosphate-sugar epimerase